MSEFNEDESMEDADRMEDADYQILEDIEDISVKELDEALDFLVRDDGTDELEAQFYQKNIFKHLLFRLKLDGVKTINPTEIADLYEQFILGEILNRFNKEGLVESYIDENGEEFYQITESGNKVFDAAKKDKEGESPRKTEEEL